MSDRQSTEDVDPAPPASFATAAPESPDGAVPRSALAVHVTLFGATVLAVFVTAALGNIATLPERATLGAWIGAVASGWTFAVPLLTILLFHEFGHFTAARLHGVRATLPYFIPLPLLSPFGTLGAVIAMPEIRSRNALLDIGAAGPIAGMVVAVPMMLIGLSLSPVAPHSGEPYWQEGQSLLYALLKFIVHGPIADGHDVQLHPTAYAAWAGFLITMINLLPWGQLDGGHVAYALFGQRQDRLARGVRYALLPLFAYNLACFVPPYLAGKTNMTRDDVMGTVSFWLMWFVFTGVLGSFFGGANHPPCAPGALSPRRQRVAVATLLLFVALFMPTPLAFNP